VNLGYLEYVEKFQQSVQALVEAFTGMQQHTTQMTERIRARTAQTQALQNEKGQLKGVRGSREQQAFVTRTRKIVDEAANDLDEYARGMTETLGQYRTHSRAMLNNFRAAFETGRDFWDEDTRKENGEALNQLVAIMKGTLERIAEFQTTLRGIGDLTGKFRRARNRAAGILGELIAEITFSIEEANRLAGDLDDGTAVP
jgi:hypothetical protein